MTISMAPDYNNLNIERIEGYSLMESQLADSFKSVTLERLEWYDQTCHGRGITSIVDSYVYCLQEVIKTRRYFLDGDSQPWLIPLDDKIYRDPRVYCFHDPRYKESLIELNCSPFPSGEVITCLEEELAKAISVLDGFKKLNWALKKKFGWSIYSVIGGSIEGRVAGLHQSLVEISAFHQSDKNKPFIIGKDGLSENLSNRERNKLYCFVDNALLK